MRLLLDREALDHDALTVGEALSAAADHARDHGRIIVEVLVDGLPWGEDRLADESDTHEPKEVACLTEDPVGLVREVLSDAASALIEADRLQRSAAELIQSDQLGSGLTRLSEALAIWSSVREALAKSAALLEIDLDRLSIAGTAVSTRIGELGDLLQRLHAAITQEDPVTVADILLYEMPELITCWREILEAVVEAASREPEP